MPFPLVRPVVGIEPTYNHYVAIGYPLVGNVRAVSSTVTHP